MFFRSLACVLIAWACICLGACSSVTTTHLLGEPMDDTQARALDGAWKCEDSLFMAHYVGEGSFQIASTKWDELEKKFKTEESTFILRQVGEVLLLHVVADGKTAAAEPRYSLARLVLAGTGEVIIIPADEQKFAEAVKRKELKGNLGGEQVEGFAAGGATDVHLTGTREEIAEYLTPDRVALLFPVEKCGVARRVEGVVAQ